MSVLSIRTSSATAGGAPNAVSLGGRPSNAAPSTSNGGFFDDVSMSEVDAGHTDYRCVFIYNNTGNVWNDVKVLAKNVGGGATATVAVSSVAKAAFASYSTTVIASETTAPSVSGAYGTSCTIGTLNDGEVRAVWFKRVTPAGVAKSLNDSLVIVATGTEIVPVST